LVEFRRAIAPARASDRLRLRRLQQNQFLSNRQRHEQGVAEISESAIFVSPGRERLREKIDHVYQCNLGQQFSPQTATPNLARTQRVRIESDNVLTLNMQTF
jgi:hypothetical protein